VKTSASNGKGSGANRRAFIKKGLTAAGTASLGAGLLTRNSSLFGEDAESGSLTKGDAAILRFLAAAEILESDLWEQYWELSFPSMTGDFA
jgi:hypothetical protein